MSARFPAAIAAALLLILGGVLQAAESPKPPTKPNIVLILADDLGYGDVGCYNAQSKVPTPRLDRLAREGMRFTDAHSPSTVCTPSRYSLLTGEMPCRAGRVPVFVGAGGPCLIKEGQLTLPQMLRDRGYATAMTGKWHVGLSFFDARGQPVTRGDLDSVKRIDFSRAIPDAPVHRGFDRFFGTACCSGTDTIYAYIVNDRIPVPPVKMLDQSKLPKHPYAEDNRMGLIAPDYDLEQIDMVFLQKSKEFLADHVKRHPDQPFFLYHATSAVHLPSFAARQFQGRTNAGPHGDFIHEFDAIVGGVLDTLEQLGIADNTLVMVASDNGPEIAAVVNMRATYGHDGARPWRGIKRDDWEGGHRVPFIVRWPGKIEAGGASTQTVSLTDVMATCAAVSGASLPADAARDSCNLLPVLLHGDGPQPVRDHTLQQACSVFSIRQGPWKFLDHRGSGGNNYLEEELKPFALPDAAPDAPGQLYNLADDPGETNNLYLKRPEIVSRLSELLGKSKSEVPGPPSATRQHPNVIVILSDDMGYGDLGVYGCRDIPTPHIDSLATSGVRFTDAYANGAFCTPTRAALMSCRYQHRYGVEDLAGKGPARGGGGVAESNVLPPQANPLPQRLNAAGYHTGMVGKWHLGTGPGLTPVDRGFNEFFGFLGGGHQYFIQPDGKGEYNAPILRDRQPVKETRYLTDAFGEEAAAFVARQRGATKPFFLYLAFNAVHTPLQATEEYHARFAHIDNRQRRTYAAMLSAMDDAVGMVLAKLDEIGERDNTLVIFHNDNGGPTTRNAVNGSRNTPLRGSKCETFEGGIRVPLIMRWPGVIQPGTTYSQPVISFDISATALVAAGADTALCDGVDLLPFLTGKKTGSPHEALFWRSRTMSNNYGARQGDWKFVHSTEGDAAPGPRQKPACDMLFHLANDPGEQHDLAAEKPEKLAELKKLYEVWSAAVDADCRQAGLEPKFPQSP